MHEIKNTLCRKCGGATSIHWNPGQKTSGMDINPLSPAGMEKDCINCGFSEQIDDLENRKNV